MLRLHWIWQQLNDHLSKWVSLIKSDLYSYQKRWIFYTLSTASDNIHFEVQKDDPIEYFWKLVVGRIRWSDIYQWLECMIIPTSSNIYDHINHAIPVNPVISLYCCKVSVGVIQNQLVKSNFRFLIFTKKKLKKAWVVAATTLW